MEIDSTAIATRVLMKGSDSGAVSHLLWPYYILSPHTSSIHIPCYILFVLYMLATGPAGDRRPEYRPGPEHRPGPVHKDPHCHTRRCVLVTTCMSNTSLLVRSCKMYEVT